MARASFNPLDDVRTLFALVRLLYEEKPDIIHYTQKSIIYAGIANRIVRRGRYFPMVRPRLCLFRTWAPTVAAKYRFQFLPSGNCRGILSHSLQSRRPH